MRDPNYPNLGLIFTTRWQWAFVIKGGAARFYEVVMSDREARHVKRFDYIGFRIVRTL